MVVHYLVKKNEITKLPKEVDYNTSGPNNAAAGSLKKTNATGIMKFTLSPLSATTKSMTIPEFPGFLSVSLIMTLMIGTTLLMRSSKRML